MIFELVEGGNLKLTNTLHHFFHRSRTPRRSPSGRSSRTAAASTTWKPMVPGGKHGRRPSVRRDRCWCPACFLVARLRYIGTFRPPDSRCQDQQCFLALLEALSFRAKADRAAACILLRRGPGARVFGTRRCLVNGKGPLVKPAPGLSLHLKLPLPSRRNDLPIRDTLSTVAMLRM